MYRRKFVSESIARALGVVPRKVRHQLAVEESGRHKVARVEINELILDRAIEPFHMGVHLRGLGIGVVAGEMKPAHFLVKVFLEFRTIVGQDELKWEREYLAKYITWESDSQVKVHHLGVRLPSDVRENIKAEVNTMMAQM